MLAYPLDLRFKLIAIASQIYVRDATGSLRYYVRQKAFKLKEAVTVFADEAQRTPLYRIAADRVLDISARYTITSEAGRTLGALQRRGMRSIWRAHYEIQREGELAFVVTEENPWVKLIDGFVGEIPIVGMFTGYLLHPAYAVTRAAGGTRVLRIVKQPAFFEGRYRVEQVAPMEDQEEELAVLSLLMMVLLERARG
jgi:uncharacterized protein YxjI